jgi:hypothetical protein
MEEGELSEARGLLREGVGMARDMGSLRQFGICLEYCARFAALEEQFFDAARLWGAAEGLREATGLVIPPLAVAGRDEWMDRCREALGVAAFEAAWERGRKATPVQAMDTALAALS